MKRTHKNNEQIYLVCISLNTPSPKWNGILGITEITLDHLALVRDQKEACIEKKEEKKTCLSVCLSLDSPSPYLDGILGIAKITVDHLA